jgi:glucose/arabinose dehydrogenase
LGLQLRAIAAALRRPQSYMEASMRIQSLALSALLLSATLALPALAAKTAVSRTGFSESALATGLEMPWEIALGPDRVLWVPEPMDKGVSRIDLDAGMKSVALAIGEVFVGDQHEDLLGGVHPEFGMGNDHDFVFVAYATAASRVVEGRRPRSSSISGRRGGHAHRSGRASFRHLPALAPPKRLKSTSNLQCPFMQYRIINRQSP